MSAQLLSGLLLPNAHQHGSAALLSDSAGMAFHFLLAQSFLNLVDETGGITRQNSTRDRVEGGVASLWLSNAKWAFQCWPLWDAKLAFEQGIVIWRSCT